jgi:glucose 1-dehydrogenase
LPGIENMAALEAMSVDPSRPLRNQKAVVTGGSSGLGAGCALNLSATGASVVIDQGSEADKAGRVVATVRVAGSKAIAIQADMSKQVPLQVISAETTGRLSEQSP